MSVDHDDRRRERRARGVAVFANKYLDGTPHLIELLDVSSDGLLVRRFLEPEHASDTFALQLFIGGFTSWAWARRVWRDGDREAMRIVSSDPFDRARIRKFLRGVIAA